MKLERGVRIVRFLYLGALISAATVIQHSSVAATTPGAWESGFTIADGCSWSVSATAAGPDGKLYLGGQSVVCGNKAGTLFVYDPDSDTFSSIGEFSSDTGFDPGILDIDFGGGSLFVVGGFDTIDGLRVNGVAEFDLASETWSSLGTDAENGVTGGNVQSVAADADNVYVGFFRAEDSRVGTLDVGAIARWDVAAQTWSAMNGGLDLPGQNDPSSNDARVTDLLLDGGTLHVGGAFTSAGGASIENVATFDPDSGWAAIGAGLDGTVNALAIDGASVFAAGGFTDPDTGEFSEVFEFDGTEWSPLAPPLSAVGFAGKTASSLLVADGFLYLGGWFSSVDGVPVRNVARFDLTARSWAALGSGSDEGVRGSSASGLFRSAADTLSSLGGKVYVGGFLTAAGSTPVNNIARWNPATGNWSALGPAAGQGVNAQETWALATDGTELLVGGPLAQAGTERTIWIARRDIASGTWSALGDQSTRNFFSVLIDVAFAGGEIFATAFSGLVDSIDNPSTFENINGVVRWNDSTQDWETMGPDGSVGLTNAGNAATASAMAGGQEALYVSGTFDQAGDTPVSNIARWDVAGRTWSALADGLDAAAQALLVGASGEVYAAGPFSTAGGIAANGIAMWDPNSQSWSALGAGIANADGSDVRVGSLAELPDGDLVVAGAFDTADAVSVNNIARWDGTQWQPLGDGLSGEFRGQEFVETLAVADSGELFAGGFFTGSGTQPLDQLARWDGSSWSAVGPGLADSEVEGDSISVLEIVGPDLFVAGGFGAIGGKVSANFAQFVRDLGGAVLDIEVSAQEAGMVAAESPQADKEGKSSIQGQSTSLVYTVDVRNLGRNKAADVDFSLNFSPAPVSVEWTCAPLPESRAICPQSAGSAVPDLLLDLPFESGLRFELAVEVAGGTVFQDVTAQASAEQQFGDPDASRTVNTEIVSTSDEGLFKSGFEP